MATKYHLSANGPRPCSADVRGCPLGADSPHFATQAEAMTAYEAKMTEAFGQFSTLDSSTGEKIRQASYRTRDYGVKFTKSVVSSPATLAAMNTLLAIQQSPQRASAAINSKLSKLANFAIRLNNKMETSFGNMNRRRADDYAASVARQSEINVVREANKIKNAEQRRIMMESAKSRFSAPALMRGERSASALKLGTKLSNGSIVTGLERRADGNMIVTSTSSQGRVNRLTVASEAKFSVETAPKRAMKSFKNSSFGTRLSTASALQAEAARTLFGTHNRQAQKQVNMANVGAMQTIARRETVNA